MEKRFTHFLPVEKASPEELDRQRARVALAADLLAGLDATLGFALILNRQRQALFANKPFREFLAAHGVQEFLGQRPGNLAGCVHSEQAPGGCGTTEACLRCGAGQALAQALAGKEAVRECRIMSRALGEDLDLRVCVTPFTLKGEELLLMSLVDISAEKRREVLEKLFFHDIINTAGGLQGLIDLMTDASPEEIKGYIPPAADTSVRLVEMILSQKDLAAAERGELEVRPSSVSSATMLSEITSLFSAHEVAGRKSIRVAPDSEDLTLRTDRQLFARVLGNLVKNALEAEKAGAEITLCCRAAAGAAVFTVRNPSPMPEDARLQVFQRSFSTKGPGRGLGTYSIRLLTEKYLKGKVSFATGPEGTVFRAEYPLDF